MDTINSRHPLDVARILSEYGQGFIDNHKLCPAQLKAFSAILRCRTAAMGGHVEGCDHCGHQQVAYNSCRNRHCNKCQYIKQLKWVDQLQSKLPVCRYIHMVFTIPTALHKTFYINQRICYDVLFKAASLALKKASQNPKFLGADTGAVAVLHTWGQALTYHPHIHMIIPAGGLSADGVEWVQAPRKFFLPVKALSKIFRGVMWALLEKQVALNNIKLPGSVQLKRKLYEKNWNVFTCKSMAGPQSVLRYLGKYTHRVAIDNSRLVAIDQGKVTFRWKDYRKGLQNMLLTLDAGEFIGRFLLHVLPSGFYKIRYYGILAAANGNKRLQCVALINHHPYVSLLQGLSSKQVVEMLTGKDPELCPKCGKGKMMPYASLDST